MHFSAICFASFSTLLLSLSVLTRILVCVDCRDSVVATPSVVATTSTSYLTISATSCGSTSIPWNFTRFLRVVSPMPMTMGRHEL